MDDDLRVLHDNSDPNTLAQLREEYAREYSIVAIKDAYLRLAEYAYCRPEAPTDGFGNVPFEVDLDDPIRLEIEAWRAGLRWYKQDDKQLFTVNGCPDYVTIRAMFFALRAAAMLRRSRSTCSLELVLNALPPDPKVTFDG